MCGLLIGSSLSALPATWAVIVGIADYKEDSYKLNYTAEEAVDVRNLLIDSCGVSPHNIILLTDSAASKESITEALTSLNTHLSEQDTVLFYFSGHGAFVQDHDGDEEDGVDEALVPWDAAPGREDKLILDDLLGWHINRLEAGRVLVLVDACYSGGQGKSVAFVSASPKGPRDSIVKDIFTSQESRSGRVLLAASSPEESAWEVPTLKRSLFTHFLLRAIGEQQADADADGRITIDEIADYVSQSVSEWGVAHGLTQTTTYMKDPLDLNLSVAPQLGQEADEGVPELCVSTNSLTIQSPAIDGSLEVWNCGTGEMSYDIVSDASWISSELGRGISAGDHDRVVVTVAPSGLGYGQHTSVLRIVPDRCAPQYVTVTYDLEEPQPELCIYPNVPQIEFEVGDNDASFELWNCGAGQLTFVIDSGDDWLTVAPGFGAATGDRQAITLRVIREALPSGSDASTSLTIVTSDGAVRFLRVVCQISDIPDTDSAPGTRDTGIIPVQSALATLQGIQRGYTDFNLLDAAFGSSVLLEGVSAVVFALGFSAPQLADSQLYGSDEPFYPWVTGGLLGLAVSLAQIGALSYYPVQLDVANAYIEALEAESEGRREEIAADWLSRFSAREELAKRIYSASSIVGGVAFALLYTEQPPYNWLVGGALVLEGLIALLVPDMFP